MGPHSRDVLQAVTSADCSNQAFPFGHIRKITIEGVLSRALRVTYVGELGYELHAPIDGIGTVFDALMAAGAFGMIILLSRAGFEADEIDDFKGLNQRNSWFAFMMLILMFSMAGVPPTVGFYAKLSVLQAVVDIDMVWLAAVAVFFSVIGAFYYIRLIKVMYFDKAEDEQPLAHYFDLRFGLTANGLAVLLLGIFPGALMAVCNQVIS